MGIASSHRHEYAAAPTDPVAIGDGTAVDVPLASPLAAPRAGVPDARTGRIEWGTLALGATIYVSWLALTLLHGILPWWLLAPLGGLVVAWHSGFQHEAIHRHPTRNRTLNAVLAGAPLLLWLPYPIYERTHLLHHRDDRVTDPLDDPESFYVTAGQWRRMSAIERGLRLAANTLAGRLLIGPFLVVGGFLAGELRNLCAGDTGNLRPWLVHGLALVPVVAWITLVAEMPLTVYAGCFVFTGTSVVLIRSFLEHRPTPVVEHRTAVVDDRGLLALIFLNNNLHALHHERPELPWYELPRHYRARAGDIAARNGGFVFSGYAEVARRYLFRLKDHPVHPAHRA